MERRGIGKQEPSFYISFALYFEKYERDFKRAEDLYLRGLTAIKRDRGLQDVVLQKLKDFGSRMQKRTQRDVISQLAGSQTQYQQQINSKKRKFQEAFEKDKVDLDDSTDSK